MDDDTDAIVAALNDTQAMLFGSMVVQATIIKVMCLSGLLDINVAIGALEGARAMVRNHGDPTGGKESAVNIALDAVRDWQDWQQDGEPAPRARPDLRTIEGGLSADTDDAGDRGADARDERRPGRRTLQ